MVDHPRIEWVRNTFWRSDTTEMWITQFKCHHGKWFHFNFLVRTMHKLPHQQAAKLNFISNSSGAHLSMHSHEQVAKLKLQLKCKTNKNTQTRMKWQWQCARKKNGIKFNLKWKWSFKSSRRSACGSLRPWNYKIGEKKEINSMFLFFFFFVFRILKRPWIIEIAIFVSSCSLVLHRLGISYSKLFLPIWAYSLLFGCYRCQ